MVCIIISWKLKSKAKRILLRSVSRSLRTKEAIILSYRMVLYKSALGLKRMTSQLLRNNLSVKMNLNTIPPYCIKMMSPPVSRMFILYKMSKMSLLLGLNSEPFAISNKVIKCHRARVVRRSCLNSCLFMKCLTRPMDWFQTLYSIPIQFLLA